MSDDRIDRELREYAERWRADVPSIPLPSFDAPADGTSRPLLLTVAAAAVAAVAVVLGVTLVTTQGSPTGRPATPQSPAATTTSGTPDADAIVPWAPLDATHPDLPKVTTPASPDPAPAAAAPPCTAADLRAVSQVEAAAGTAVLYLTIRPSSPDVSCHLAGHPQVEFLDKGRPVDIPSRPTPDGSDYEGPVLVTQGRVATLSMYWGSAWCTDPVHNDRIRVALTSGAFEVDGYGASPWCNTVPGSGPNPVTVGPFQPQDFRRARVSSAFSRVDGSITLLDRPVPGEDLTFLVTLTARHDVSLAPCPDYTIAQYGSWDDVSVARYALNCAAVPYRDAGGTPYLPADVPVRFMMRTHLQGPDAEAHKNLWSLEAPGAPALAITTR